MISDLISRFPEIGRSGRVGVFDNFSSFDPNGKPGETFRQFSRNWVFQSLESRNQIALAILLTHHFSWVPPDRETKLRAYFVYLSVCSKWGREAATGYPEKLPFFPRQTNRASLPS